MHALPLISFIQERVRLSGRFSPYLNSHVPTLYFCKSTEEGVSWIKNIGPFSTQIRSLEEELLIWILPQLG